LCHLIERNCNVSIFNRWLNTINLKLWNDKDGYAIEIFEMPACAYCLKRHGVAFHHIVGRRYKSLKDQLVNVIPLCTEHHVLSSEFSAHLTPKKFKEWLYKIDNGIRIDILDKLRRGESLVSGDFYSEEI